MKKLIGAAVFLVSTVSHADVIKCFFTEPFVNSTYSMTQSTLTYIGYDYKATVIKDVSFQIKSAGVFELVSKDKKVLQTLTLNNKGSDGMSDTIYPYDVKDNNDLTQNGYGGCSSNYLSAKESK